MARYTAAMLSTQTILRLLKPGYICPLFLYLLLASALLLVDAFSLVYFAESYGAYLVLGVSGAVSLAGVLITIGLIARRLRLLRRAVFLAQDPTKHYRVTASLTAGGMLLLSPGAVTTAVAFICLLPVLRLIPGTVLCYIVRRELEPVYDYLKMEEPYGLGGASQADSDRDGEHVAAAVAAEEATET